jgi:hypothetical protein
METQHSLMTEVGSACQNMFEFSKAFTAAAWIRHFGAEMHAKDLTTIKGHLDLFRFRVLR